VLLAELWTGGLTDLAKRGVRKLAVICPAFVADCLETLEEIGLRAREQFRSLGGEDLTLVPSLNASAEWIEVVASLARRHSGTAPALAKAAAAALP